MKKILTLDAENYPGDMEEIFRIAVRGIIFIGGKILMIEDNLGEVKLPGGGMEDGENDRQTLCREVREETGFVVVLDSVVPFGEIEEKRLSAHEDRIWHQISRLYFCDVEEDRQECEYSANEKDTAFGLCCIRSKKPLRRMSSDYKPEKRWSGICGSTKHCC